MEKQNKGTFSPKEEQNYDYYSRILKKPFNNLSDLKSAEDEYNKAHAEEIKKSEERKARAKEVEDAYKEIFVLEKEKQQAVDAANRRYIELRNAFIRDYGSFHTSYTETYEMPKRINLNTFFSDLWKDLDLFN